MNPIALDASQQAELHQLAEQTGKPWPVVFAEALAGYRQHEASVSNGETTESFVDAASRLGLIGCLEGGPPDLSSNPAYMEGFGGRVG